MTEKKIWARIGAIITVPVETGHDDISREFNFDELYAENKLIFEDDSYIPEESEDSAEIVEDSEDEDFSLEKLPISDDTQRSLRNVLQSVENIRSYISYADCDPSLKQDISDMSERFLKALKRKISDSF